MAESHLEGPSFRVLHDAVLRRLKASDTEQFATRLKSSLGGEEMSSMVLAPPYPMASSVAATLQRSQFRLVQSTHGPVPSAST
jgi:hypothetical protein